MNTASAVRVVSGLLALFSLVAVMHAGGGSLVTVKSFPGFAVAGKPLTLTFKVWVPSLEPLTGLHPVIRASNGKEPEVRAAAKAASAAGEYTVSLTLPEAGDWVMTFDTEYRNATTLPPLEVIAPGTPAPEALPLAGQGLRLFTVKGCNGCHVHPEVKGGRIYGPDLTGMRFRAEYLRRFLADPSMTPVPELVCSADRSVCGAPYPMPNLDLTSSEIEAFVAFLTEFPQSPGERGR